jgi:hypothetical protein
MDADIILVFVGRTEGKILLGRSRYRHENNIKKAMKEIECEAVDFSM